LQLKGTSANSRQYATYVPLLVRDAALQLVKLQFEKTAESPETIVSSADADDSPP